MLDRHQLLLRLPLSADFVRLLLLLRHVYTARHKYEIETLNLLQVSRHTFVFHFVLKTESVRKLVFLLASADARTATSDPNQVLLVDGVANVQHLDNLALCCFCIAIGVHGLLECFTLLLLHQLLQLLLILLGRILLL